MISLVIDYERIGDYAKDLANMREEYDFREPFHPDQREELHRMKDIIIEMFPEAHDSFMSPDQKYPTPVTKLEANLKEHYDNLRDLTLKKNIHRDEALVEIISGLGGVCVALAGNGVASVNASSVSVRLTIHSFANNLFLFMAPSLAISFPAKG